MGAGGDESNRRKRRNHLESSSERMKGPRGRRAKERARRKRGEGSRWIEKGKTSLEQGFRRPLAPERKEVVEKADGREKVREVPGGSREDRADRPTREGSSGQDASERDQGQLSGGVTMKDRSQKVKDAEQERETAVHSRL